MAIFSSLEKDVNLVLACHRVAASREVGDLPAVSYLDVCLRYLLENLEARVEALLLVPRSQVPKENGVQVYEVLLVGRHDGLKGLVEAGR